MKNPLIAACLAVAICFSASTARAADWSNGTFSCDLTVVSTGWVPWEWGVWTNVNMKFYQNAKPATAVVFSCNLVDNSKYFCQRPSSSFFLPFQGWFCNTVSIPKFNRGISKSQACGALFGDAFKKY